MKPSYQNLPSTPGVYIMKGAKGEILYIGKAVNLKRRVSSYFLRAHDYRLEKLVSLIKEIDHLKTDSGLEALILESELIKKHQPPFNVLEKDDKSFLYVAITKEKFPRVLLVRGKDRAQGEIHSNPKFKTPKLYYGPFTSAVSLREALKIIRRIFPYSVHEPGKIYPRPCFDYSIGQCPGVCANLITKKDYAKTIRNIRLFFTGKKLQILKSLEKEMKQASKALEFEKAGKIRHQMFALKHIQDVAFIAEDSHLKPITHNPGLNFRIEGYDISNTSGTSATGSMVVFSAKGGYVSGGESFKPDKNQYRKFRIRSIKSPDDTGMLREVLSRRLEHRDWTFPNLILIDGGRGQINAAKSVLAEARIKIPVVGIVKGPERKRNDIIGILPKGVEKKTLIQVRDEAHRFAISYHKKLRGVITR
ncbi:MAG: Excinuclease ABC subunit C [Parcubacteria group bacterium Gr01-1014_20]|nr:MAG: Excinuclease ABC subunit C [Parcubacteria group bacterium Gr01-1014_20]